MTEAGVSAAPQNDDPPLMRAQAGNDKIEEWQPIETAPKDGTTILLYFPNGYWADYRNVAIGFWGGWSDDASDAGWYGDESNSNTMTDFGSFPTHWMKLPDPPKD